MNDSEIDTNMENFLSDIFTSQSFQDVNSLIEDCTNIVNLFSSDEEAQSFLVFLKSVNHTNSKSFDTEKGWGDVQTPNSFVTKIYQIIHESGFFPDILLEPTFGKGNFLLGLELFFPNVSIVYGIEVQREYVWSFILESIRKGLSKGKPRYKTFIFQNDFFTHKFLNNVLLNTNLKILIIGNPPWITLSELSQLNSTNIPMKSNFKTFKGSDAITGKSNFDISESIIIKLLEAFKDHSGKIALLCKDIVIRNILKMIPLKQFHLSNIHAIKFDVNKIFGKKCDASLFLADLTPGYNEFFCYVSSINSYNRPTYKFGWVKNAFVSNIDKYKPLMKFDSKSPFIWRQGIKHDCSKILELIENQQTGIFYNKLREEVIIDNELLYPLVKSSDLRCFEINTTNKALILTQKSLREDSKEFNLIYPKTWNYLNHYQKYFDKRKSRVFSNKWKFAIFGIGNYTFLPFKVAVAGMYKKIRFSLVSLINNKPVVFDDASYYLSFENYFDALITCTALNSKTTINFIETIAFKESKRPFTKEVLMRVNLTEIIQELTIDAIFNIWNENGYSKSNNFTESQILQWKLALLERIKKGTDI